MPLTFTSLTPTLSTSLSATAPWDTSPRPPLASNVPKTIWMMWLQGFDQAPPLVRQCHASWKALNPDWNIIFLDETNFREYVGDLEIILGDNKGAQIQARSDIIRISLLAKYGGVWIDATCFCRAPLDSWLPEYARSGFFAFYKPHTGKLMDNWFMASSQGCYLTQKLLEVTSAYWQTNRLKRYQNNLVSKTLRLLNRSTHTTKFWFSYPVRKLLKAYPYSWFQFLFTETVRNDPRSKAVWQETPKFSADVPHKLLRLGLLEPLSQEAKEEIDSQRAPLYKLTWKYDAGKYNEQSTLHYLLSSKAAQRAAGDL